MATSQNGWYAFTSYSDRRLRNLSWVSGSVNKAAHEIFEMFCADFNAQVERIHVGSSWGFAPRPIRGASTQLSNHASGTAVDLNAPNHGLGRTGTFSSAQVHAIQSLLKKYGYAIRWGGNYAGRKDPMHFEIDTSPAKVAAVVASLKKGGNVKPAGKPSKPVAKRVKANSGNSKSDNVAIANLLNNLGYKAGAPDGVPGTYLRRGVKRYQKAQTYFPGMKRDGDWGPMVQAHYDWTKGALQDNLNKWNAVQRRGLLALDGDLAKLTQSRVRAVQKDNLKKYTSIGGGKLDGEPGPLTCKLLGIKEHPSA